MFYLPAIISRSLCWYIYTTFYEDPKIFKENTLTTISNSPLLQVIDQNGSVMLANITGTDNPVAILDDKALDLLFDQNRNARAEALKTGGNANATLELCTTLDGVLKSYRRMRDEYHHRIDIELERAEAEQRLQDAINAIQKSTPPQ
jgi:hypothetical protein